MTLIIPPKTIKPSPDIDTGAAGSEGCKGCSLPSLSPPYFFLRSKIFLPILVFHTTIDNIFFEKNNFCTKNGNT